MKKLILFIIPLLLNLNGCKSSEVSPAQLEGSKWKLTKITPESYVLPYCQNDKIMPFGNLKMAKYYNLHTLRVLIISLGIIP